MALLSSIIQLYSEHLNFVLSQDLTLRALKQCFESARLNSGCFVSPGLNDLRDAPHGWVLLFSKINRIIPFEIVPCSRPSSDYGGFTRVLNFLRLLGCSTLGPIISIYAILVYMTYDATVGCGLFIKLSQIRHLSVPVIESLKRGCRDA